MKLGMRSARAWRWATSGAPRGSTGTWTSSTSRVMAIANTASEKKTSRSSAWSVLIAAFIAAPCERSGDYPAAMRAWQGRRGAGSEGPLALHIAGLAVAADEDLVRRALRHRAADPAGRAPHQLGIM